MSILQGENPSIKDITRTTLNVIELILMFSSLGLILLIVMLPRTLRIAMFATLQQEARNESNRPFWSCTSLKMELVIFA